MKIPDYYCPRCKAFKKWRKVTLEDICKDCGYPVIETYKLFHKFAKEYCHFDTDNK